MRSGLFCQREQIFPGLFWGNNGKKRRSRVRIISLLQAIKARRSIWCRRRVDPPLLLLLFLDLARFTSPFAAGVRPRRESHHGGLRIKYPVEHPTSNGSPFHQILRQEKCVRMWILRWFPAKTRRSTAADGSWVCRRRRGRHRPGKLLLLLLLFNGGGRRSADFSPKVVSCRKV